MNAKRREYMIDMLPKRITLMRHGESQGNRDMAMYTIIPDHNIQSMAQGIAQVFRVGEHLHRVIGSDTYSPDWRVQFYVSPYTRTRSTFYELRRYFLKKMIIDVTEKSQVRE
ncbi:Phosphoglycerate mutase-like protein AT74 [Glycine soja]|uniref:phosphoglycerate mutase-like protein AT74 n=1 Tax=Glycine soja TaxID=3848 RepID=UPI00023D56B8|nr:phosphoglycerate mutase-like protein AT74 [Glycine soja]KAH1203503.1 Phosphoglycerate mutase-like protein AT74 [Glycine max]